MCAHANAELMAFKHSECSLPSFCWYHMHISAFRCVPKRHLHATFYSMLKP